MVRAIAFSRMEGAFLVLCLLVTAGSGAAAASAAAASEAATDTLSVTASAEVEKKVMRQGRAAIKLVPADHVVPGDEVIYTLEIRNTGTAPVLAPVVRFAIPAHLHYLADSAAGPGAEVSYSVDGGRTFDVPENLTAAGPGGQLRPAAAADYTHIRWQMKHGLKVNSVAFVRFRAVVK